MIGSKGIPGASSPAPPSHHSSPGAWEEVRWQEEEEVSSSHPSWQRGGTGSGDTGPLSPRFSQALSFLGGRNWREGG